MPPRPSPPASSARLLRLAQNAFAVGGYSAFGLAGHVGTNNTSCDHWRVLLALMRVLAGELARDGHAMTVFDLGGGFCDQATAAAAHTTQAALLGELAGAVAEFRSALPDARMLAEPGRFFVADAAALVTTVKSVRRLPWRTGAHGEHLTVDHLEVHIDDGIYGCLMGQQHDQKAWEFHAVRPADEAAAATGRLPAHIWGATCDSYDRIEGWRWLPADLAVGERLLIPGAGAYSLVTRTDFNAAAPVAVWCADQVGADREQQSNLSMGARAVPRSSPAPGGAT